MEKKIKVFLASLIVLVVFQILSPDTITFKRGMEIIRETGYKINENAIFTEYQAAGIQVTEDTWKGFLTVCDRLRVDIGSLTVCFDIEARIIFVFDPNNAPEDREITYVQFTS